jgi:hypothetical protein
MAEVLFCRERGPAGETQKFINQRLKIKYINLGTHFVANNNFKCLLFKIFAAFSTGDRVAGYFQKA